MHRRLHLLPALLAVGASLAVPFLTAADPQTSGTAGSVTARAAQSEGTPGGNVRYPVGGPALESSKAIAAAQWGAQACNGVFEITWAALDAGTNATASWRNPTDAWGNPGENFDCRVTLNTQADFDFPKLCTVVTHEIGHLVGRQHDAASGRLMSAFYTTPLAACTAASPESAPAPAAAPARSSQAARRPLRSGRASTRHVRRCVVRVSAGQRSKRCRTVRVRAAAAKRS